MAVNREDFQEAIVKIGRVTKVYINGPTLQEIEELGIGLY